MSQKTESPNLDAIQVGVQVVIQADDTVERLLAVIEHFVELRDLHLQTQEEEPKAPKASLPVTGGKSDASMPTSMLPSSMEDSSSVGNPQDCLAVNATLPETAGPSFSDS